MNFAVFFDLTMILGYCTTTTDVRWWGLLQILLLPAVEIYVLLAQCECARNERLILAC